MSDGAPRDTTLLMDEVDAIRLYGNSPTEVRQASLIVCDRAAGPGDAVQLLRALGLAEQQQPRVWRKQDAVLGHARTEGAP